MSDIKIFLYFRKCSDQSRGLPSLLIDCTGLCCLSGRDKGGVNLSTYLYLVRNVWPYSRKCTPSHVFWRRRAYISSSFIYLLGACVVRQVTGDECFWRRWNISDLKLLRGWLWRSPSLEMWHCLVRNKSVRISQERIARRHRRRIQVSSTLLTSNSKQTRLNVYCPIQQI